MIDSEHVAVGAVFLVVLAGIAGATTVATQSTTPSVMVESSPTDPNAKATHAVVFTPVESTGETFNDIRVNYSVDEPAADVSNVNNNTIERIGIDRDGDDNGTQIDVAANVTEVSDRKNGTAVLIQTNDNLSINSSDQIVVVLRPVQNPQNNGTAEVEATVNTQSTAPESATDTVTYENNSAFVNFNDQSRNDTVRVDDVSLSEDGHVVILNESGERPDEVRGATFVKAG